jgi:peptidoglycan/LPS O-acetylase OafA/YrhL
MQDRHSFGLDMIRAFAIILVIICHIGTGIDTKVALFFGYFGVELFFVLSGFLIGGSLINIVNKEGDLNIKDISGFWKKRWFRTLPNYYLVLIVFLLLDLVLSIYKVKIFSLLDFVKYFTFTQNLMWLQPVALHTFTSGFFALSWSLAIEEWFYLLFPLTLLVCSKVIKNKKKVLLTSAGIFILFFTLLRIIISIINPNLS